MLNYSFETLKNILLIRNPDHVAFNTLTMRTEPKGRFRSQ